MENIPQTSSPLVSVLMTAYNREKYISEAIESVIAQTYTNWELIICDDQSSDNTLCIAKEYAKRDPRINVYLNETNLGDYPNRNKAASHAQGLFLKYLDSDDLLYPRALETMVGMMVNNPLADWGVCARANSNYKTVPCFLSPYEIYYNHYLGKNSVLGASPLTVIMKKSVFDEVGGFTGKQHLGDFELWHILGRKHSVLILPPKLAWYRTHPDQQMNDNRTDPFVPVKYLINSIEHLNHPDCPLSKIEVAISVHNLNRSISRAVIRAFLKGNFSKSFQIKKAFNKNYIKILYYAFSFPK